MTIRTNNAITKDDVIQRVRQFGDLAFHVHQMGRTTTAAIIIDESWNNNAIESLKDHIRPAAVSSIAIYLYLQI